MDRSLNEPMMNEWMNERTYGYNGLMNAGKVDEQCMKLTCTPKCI